ncbi:MAG TPA: hypothetical protein DCE56_27285 [Cyanobacteria bacterium UBA8553]|nr:hypothetical protein [Cyanobacteria bacterium UBA8553]HAJ60880.1 hypothetical protein [Cyanobacteria bacterium UBA8543]
MFIQFRAKYPKGSLVTELSAIDHGKFIVRCLVQDEGVTLVTALAAAETVELAEDQARSRALAVLSIDSTPVTREKESSVVPSDVPMALNPTPTSSTGFSAPPSRGQIDEPSVVAEAATASDRNSFSFSESEPDEVEDYAVPTPLVAEEIPFTEEYVSAPAESEEAIEAPLSKTQKKSKTQVNEASVMSSSPKELETNTKEVPSTVTPIDFSDIIARTNVELKRLGWTNQQGRDYLLQTYGKRSRQLLTDGELLDFLHHLESQPTLED